jgi:hypothetical protein
MTCGKKPATDTVNEKDWIEEARKYLNKMPKNAQ